MGPNSGTGVLTGREVTERHRRRSFDDGGRDWRDAPKGQGTPRWASDTGNPEEDLGQMP